MRVNEVSAVVDEVSDVVVELTVNVADFSVGGQDVELPTLAATQKGERALSE
ncbi:hypothetical protein [Roseateles sp. MS654]|uniref:hypothetical protein n=1 Tax=Roseateles sp. MS654 TaxID=3412685 RepID=UPI003C2C3281